MRILHYKLLTVSFFCLFAVNCTTTGIPLEEDPAPIIALVKYNTDVKTIIDNNCLNCHGTATPRIGGIPLFNYTQVREEAEFGSLINRMNSTTNPMPQSGILSAEKLAIIDKWKADGFLEN